MSTFGFNPAVAIVSFIEGLQKGASWLYARKEDPQGPITVDGEETDEVGYQTDGSQSIHYAVSIGNGRGSSKVELTGAQFEGVAAALESWDPDADLSGLPPAECIARTLTRTADGVTTFKISLAKNSRSTRIPAGEWEGFVALMRANANSVDKAVAYYRDQAEAAEADANA